MLNRIHSILIINLVCVSGHAANVCETLADCTSLPVQQEAELDKIAAKNLQIKVASLPPFTDIIKNADGTIHYMVQSSDHMASIGSPLPAGELGALEYCKSLGMRLPTAKELAQLSQSLGAVGISETPQAGYYSVGSFADSDGTYDIFFFNSDGYINPNGDLSHQPIWSSSVSWFHTDFALRLLNNSGDIEKENRGSEGAVRCVAAGH